MKISSACGNATRNSKLLPPALPPHTPLLCAYMVRHVCSYCLASALTALNTLLSHHSAHTTCFARVAVAWLPRMPCLAACGGQLLDNCLPWPGT